MHRLTSAALAGGTYRVDTITGTPSVPVYTMGASQNRGLTWAQPSGSILSQAAPLSGTSTCGAPLCPLETQDAQFRSTPVFRDGFIYYAQMVGIPTGGLEPIRITPLAKQEPLYLGGDKVQTATYRAFWNRSELFG